MSGKCGTCTACCKVFHIAELEKPAGKWCSFCTVGEGCRRYGDRPRACTDFECVWLQSQSRPDNEKFGLELRPDKCKVVISSTTNPTVMSVITLAPNAEKNKPVQDVIQAMVRGGYRVAVGPPGGRMVQVHDFSGVHTEYLSEPDEQGMQWSEPK